MRTTEQQHRYEERLDRAMRRAQKFADHLRESIDMARGALAPAPDIPAPSTAVAPEDAVALLARVIGGMGIKVEEGWTRRVLESPVCAQQAVRVAWKRVPQDDAELRLALVGATLTIIHHHGGAL